jgi:hypothetical protein
MAGKHRISVVFAGIRQSPSVLMLKTADCSRRDVATVARPQHGRGATSQIGTHGTARSAAFLISVSVQFFRSQPVEVNALNFDTERQTWKTQLKAIGKTE